jgi:hypothetical protein
MKLNSLEVAQRGWNHWLVQSSFLLLHQELIHFIFSNINGEITLGSETRFIYQMTFLIHFCSHVCEKMHWGLSIQFNVWFTYQSHSWSISQGSKNSPFNSIFESSSQARTNVWNGEQCRTRILYFLFNLQQWSENYLVDWFTVKDRCWCTRAASQPNNPLKAIKRGMKALAVMRSSLSCALRIEGFLITQANHMTHIFGIWIARVYPFDYSWINLRFNRWNSINC